MKYCKECKQIIKTRKDICDKCKNNYVDALSLKSITENISLIELAASGVVLTLLHLQFGAMFLGYPFNIEGFLLSFLSTLIIFAQGFPLRRLNAKLTGINKSFYNAFSFENQINIIPHHEELPIFVEDKRIKLQHGRICLRCKEKIHPEQMSCSQCGQNSYRYVEILPGRMIRSVRISVVILTVLAGLGVIINITAVIAEIPIWESFWIIWILLIVAASMLWFIEYAEMDMAKATMMAENSDKKNNQGNKMPH